VALILFASALLLGAAVVRRLGFALYLFEAVALAVVLGLFGSVWLVPAYLVGMALILGVPSTTRVPSLPINSLRSSAWPQALLTVNPCASPWRPD